MILTSRSPAQNIPVETFSPPYTSGLRHTAGSMTGSDTVCSSDTKFDPALDPEPSVPNVPQPDTVTMARGL